jgi:hypothetical protein
MKSCGLWKLVSHIPRSNFEAIRLPWANSEEYEDLGFDHILAYDHVWALFMPIEPRN